MRESRARREDPAQAVDFGAESRITTTCRSGREGPLIEQRPDDVLDAFARILADLARRKAQQERE